MNELILRLSDLEYIKIATDDGVDFKEIDYCCSPTKVYFVNQQELRICQESIGIVFEGWIARLKKAIDNKLLLHESLTEDLGIIWNYKSCQIPYNFFMMPTQDGKNLYWVGSNYKIGGTFYDTDYEVTTWLYNDEAYNIVLEVTPFYKWSLDEPEIDDPDFITYDEFMKNYKPLIHRVIPHQIAVQWLEQLMQVYRSFFTNEQNFLAACDEIEKI
jgi:hypothetical protein